MRLNVCLLSLFALILSQKTSSGLVQQTEKDFCDFSRLPLASTELNFKGPRTHLPSNATLTEERTGHNLPTPEIIEAAGYPVEVHEVITEDGYILELHRIPYGLDGKVSDEARPVVLLQHGLLCSSADFVMPIPEKGLGYILADAGYDVWLGNNRGNTYSRRHLSLSPDNDYEFWTFSWDEIARYDMPAMIEGILEVTGAADLQYVGHSLGTTTYFAMHHYRPDVAAKIRLGHMLAPVATVGHMISPISWIAGLESIVGDVLSLLGVGEFLPSNWLIECMASLFCAEGDLLQPICENVLFLMCGFDEPQMNQTLLGTILQHTPAGASSFAILHYAQEVNTKGFHGYDWGSESENQAHHGGSPPEYRLDTVSTPTALYWGQNDWMAASEDIEATITGLPNIPNGMNHMVEYELWNHLDFIYAIDANKYVYPQVLENMNYCRDNDCRRM